MNPKDWLGPVLAFAVAAGGGALTYVAMAAKLEAKVEALEGDVAKLEARAERAVDEGDLSTLNDRLGKIEDKLDRVIEGRKAGRP